jgi:hypothetical protein
VAGQDLREEIGQALIALFEWTEPRLAAVADAAFEYLSDVARPEPPMSICTPDGEVLTGVLVVDRGRVLLFLGSRQPPSRAHVHPEERFDGEPLWRQPSR